MIHAAGIKATLVARIVGWMLGVPVLVHVHDQSMPPRLIRILNRLVARAADYCVGVSAATRDVAMRGYHFPAERIQVIHNGIPLDRVRRIPSDARQRQRDALSLPADARLIAMVARLHAIKGPLPMIRMLPKILSRCGDATLLMVGDGPEREACEALAAELGLGARVRFLGHRSDVPEILAAADLVVMPSVSEGLGLAAMEAIAAGRPVVAYAVGGLPEVIRDGVDGLCVPAGDASAFAAAVADLLADDAKRQRFGASAYEGAERFSLDRHVDAMLECYARVSGRRDVVPA
jgi:glycosyltransferase involved in cell wall biosynthesis